MSLTPMKVDFDLRFEGDQIAMTAFGDSYLLTCSQSACAGCNSRKTGSPMQVNAITRQHVVPMVYGRIAEQEATAEQIGQFWHENTAEFPRGVDDYRNMILVCFEHHKVEDEHLEGFGRSSDRRLIDASVRSRARLLRRWRDSVIDDFSRCCSYVPMSTVLSATYDTLGQCRLATSIAARATTFSPNRVDVEQAALNLWRAGFSVDELDLAKTFLRTRLDGAFRQLLRGQWLRELRGWLTSDDRRTPVQALVKGPINSLQKMLETVCVVENALDSVANLRRMMIDPGQMEAMKQRQFASDLDYWLELLGALHDTALEAQWPASAIRLNGRQMECPVDVFNSLRPEMVRDRLAKMLKPIYDRIAAAAMSAYAGGIEAAVRGAAKTAYDESRDCVRDFFEHTSAQFDSLEIEIDHDTDDPSPD